MRRSHPPALPTHPLGRRRGALTGLLTATVLLAGCLSAPTSPPETGVEVPAAWTAQTAPPPVEAPSTDRWWRSFDDPVLTELVAEALAANPDLAATAARIDAAVAQAHITGAPRAPRADLQGTGQRNRQNFIGFPIPGSDRQVLSTTSTSLGVTLNLSWEADLWGRLRAAERGALAEVVATRADHAGARLSLAGQTAKAYFALLEAEAQVALATRTLDNRRLTEERLRRRYESGLAPALELRLAIAERAAAEALLAQRRQQAEAARRQLELLLGRYPAGRVATADGLPRLPLPPPVGLPAELVTRRPDLAAAEQRLAAAGFAVAEARARLYPQLTLTGSTGRRSEDLEELLDADFSVWSLAGGLLQPLFQGGRLRAGVELADARLREIAQRYVRTVLDAFGEVESALDAEARLAEQVEALAEAKEQSAAARLQAEERYAAGLIDFLTVLEAQRRSLDAESRWLNARRSLLVARVDLHLALGGGFDAADLDPPEPPHRADGESETR